MNSHAEIVYDKTESDKTESALDKAEYANTKTSRDKTGGGILEFAWKKTEKLRALNRNLLFNKNEWANSEPTLDKIECAKSESVREKKM